MFIFCEALAGHDMYTVTSEVTKFKRTIQNLSVTPHFAGDMPWKLSNFLLEKN